MAFALEGKLGLNTRDFVQGADKASRAVDGIGDSFGDLPKDAGKAADGIEDEMGKLPAAGDKIGDKFGGKLGTSLVAGFGAVGVGALLQQSISQGLEADTVERTMQGKFAATAKEAEQFGKIAGDLYADGWGGGIAEVADVVGTASQQLEIETGSALETISGQVLATSQTFGQDFNAVIRSTSQLMENELAPNAEAALDLIVGAFQNGGDQAGDLLDTIDEYSQHFAAMGLSGEDAIQLIIHGFQNGQRDADKMADAVKQMFIEGTSGAPAVQAAFQSLGLDADKTAAKFAAGGTSAREAYDDVITALQKVEDPVEQNQLAVALIGTQYEDLGPKALDTLGSINTAYDPVIGDAEALAETVEATDWVKLQRRAEQSLTPIGEALIFLGNDFLSFQEKVGNAGDRFGEWIGLSQNFEAQLTDDFESVTAFVKEFDEAQLAGLGTFDEVHAKVKNLGKEFLSEADAVAAANLVAVEWNKTSKRQRESARKATEENKRHTEEWWKMGGKAAEAEGKIDSAGRVIEQTGEEAATSSGKIDSWKRSAELAKIQADGLELAVGRLKTQLSDRSAFLNVRDALNEMTTAGDATEQELIAVRTEVASYIEKIGEVPASVLTEIDTLVEEGKYQTALAKLEELEKDRQSRIDIVTYYSQVGSSSDPVQFNQGGPRAHGGPVRAGSIYEVNERGAPGELLTTGGRTYLMAASDGMVTPLARPVAPMIPSTVTQPGMDTDALARAVTAAMPATMILDVEGRQMTAHVRDVMRTADDEKAGAL